MEMHLKLLILFGITVIAAEDLYEELDHDLESQEDLGSEFVTYLSAFDKSYSEDEHIGRLDCYNETRLMIKSHNQKAMAGIYSYKLGINQFTDMPMTEVAALYTGFKGNFHKRLGETYNELDLECPESVDWRTPGVSPVKNQGRCGSCWAFSAIGALEYKVYNDTGKLVALSVQELVDCSGEQNNKGCSGGLMTKAFNYIIAKGSIATESSYCYNATDGQCRNDCTDRVMNPITGYVNIEKGCEKALMQALAYKGPVCVAMQAARRAFQLYSSGIFDDPDCSCTQLDHGVLAVGYGTENDIDYWIIKNSWGRTWGEDGYCRISRKDNICGITTMATSVYP